jgi:hypothetical protein
LWQYILHQFACATPKDISDRLDKQNEKRKCSRKNESSDGMINGYLIKIKKIDT